METQVADLKDEALERHLEQVISTIRGAPTVEIKFVPAEEITRYGGLPSPGMATYDDGWRIRIDQNERFSNKVKFVFHELAHIALGDVKAENSTPEERQESAERRQALARGEGDQATYRQREAQADQLADNLVRGWKATVLRDYAISDPQEPDFNQAVDRLVDAISKMQIAVNPTINILNPPHEATISKVERDTQGRIKKIITEEAGN